MSEPENVTMEEMQKRLATPAPGDASACPGPTAAPQDPPANSPKDLGYSEEECANFTPAQRKALWKVFKEIERAKFELDSLRLAQQDAIEAAKEAKQQVDTAREALQDLREQAEDIAAGRTKGELPGMDNASALGVDTQAPAEDAPPPGSAEAPPPTEAIPDELWTKALDHVASATRKGKGVDANGLSMCLFGNRQKQHKPRCEQILARLVAEGQLVADESSDDGKSRYLPAGKE